MIRFHGTFFVFFTFIISVSVGIFLSEDERNLVIPIIICIGIFWALFIYLWNLDGRPPVLDIGIFLTLSTVLYTVFPIINFWVGGMEFGEFSDGRLQNFAITPSDMFHFHIGNILYLLSFSVVYAMVRRPGRLYAGSCQPIPKIFFKSMLFFCIFIWIVISLLSAIYGGSFLNPTYEAESYQNYASALANLPVLLQQILFKCIVLLSVCKLAILFYLISRIKERNILWIIIFWLIFEAAMVIWSKGGRSGFIFLLASAFIYYYCLIKPIALKYLFLTALVGLFFFNILAILRSNVSLVDITINLNSALTYSLIIGNEFQSMLGTAYDVYLRKEAGVNFPAFLYFNDFMSILPPQQLLPFEKISASEWYLRELGIIGSGQGYMWGVITQSIIGFGWTELCIRGGVLAFILAKYYNYFVKNQNNFLTTFFYLYLSIRIYYTYRETTFAFLPILLWEILPIYMLLKILCIKSPRNIRNVI